MAEGGVLPPSSYALSSAFPSSALVCTYALSLPVVCALLRAIVPSPFSWLSLARAAVSPLKVTSLCFLLSAPLLSVRPSWVPSLSHSSLCLLLFSSSRVRA